jgi:FkbM family methyltransferase
MIDLPSLAGLARSLAVYYGRPWRAAQLTGFYRQFMNPGDLAFDIGAHVGNRSRAMAQAGARVVALEPQELFYRYLHRTMPKTVTVLPLAAGPRAATGIMSVSRLHPTVSTVAPGFTQTAAASDGFASVTWDRSQAIEMTTLDALIARFGEPAFIKIDVEGFEADVLAGLRRQVRGIAFEFLPATVGVAERCIERIATLGDYEFNVIRGEQLAFQAPDWMNAAEMRAWLARVKPGERSGDVYARLRR